MVVNFVGAPLTVFIRGIIISSLIGGVEFVFSVKLCIVVLEIFLLMLIYVIQTVIVISLIKILLIFTVVIVIIIVFYFHIELVHILSSVIIHQFSRLQYILFICITNELPFSSKNFNRLIFFFLTFPLIEKGIN